MAKKASKTVTVEQIGSPIRRPQAAARDAGRPRPQQDASPPHAGGHSSVRGMIASVQHLVRVVDEA